MAYFSNSSEGEVLDMQCGECPINNDDPCPILFVQLTFNYDQVKKGNEQLRDAMNMLVDSKGQCQMKPLIERAGKVNPNQKCFQRKLVFGDEEQIAALGGE